LKQAVRATAQAEIDGVPKQGKALDVAEVYAMIDSLGDVGATHAGGQADGSQTAVPGVNVSAVYLPEERAWMSRPDPSG
jgi:hypothetical protein